MRNQFMAIIALAATPLFMNAQDKEVKRMSFKEAYISIGGLTEQRGGNLQNEVRALVPSGSLYNKIAANNLNGYNYYGNQLYATNFSLGLGVQFKNKSGTSYKANPIWRFGISSLTDMGNSTSWGTSSRFRIDTFSNGSGQNFFVDSIQNKSLYANIGGNEFRIENSINFRTNPRNRVNLYGGLGFGIGFSYNTSLNLQYSENSYFSGLYTGNTGSYSSQNENYKLDNGKSAYVYIPLGAEFKLSKRNDLLKRINLFYEVRPSFTYRRVANLDASVGNGVMQSGGLRVRW
jgi:hypothetical protein